MKNWIICCGILAAVVAPTAASYQGGARGKKYTAVAVLELKRHTPYILHQFAEKEDSEEFEYFRETQKTLVTSRFIIEAALRDPNLKKRECVRREDDRHNAVTWLAAQVKAEFSSNHSGIMLVSAAEPDPEDAAAIVNAVVKAYVYEVVENDRVERRDRLGELKTLSSEKANEIISKREQLKRQLDNIGGALDDQAAAAQSQLAMSVYAASLRELDRMKLEAQSVAVKIAELKANLRDLRNEEISDVEIAPLLASNSRYRALQDRVAALEDADRTSNRASRAAGGPASEAEQLGAELTLVRKRLDELERKAKDQVRDSMRIAMSREVRRLETQLANSMNQLGQFEKTVETRRESVNSVGRTTAGIRRDKAELENLEQIMRTLAAERERLQIEIDAPPRVVIRGNPNAPASVPEAPDRQ